MKHLLLGDEAIAQGAIDAGLSGVYAYPGTPSTEITEYIQMQQAKLMKADPDAAEKRPYRHPGRGDGVRGSRQ